VSRKLFPAVVLVLFMISIVLASCTSQPQTVSSSAVPAQKVYNFRMPCFIPAAGENWQGFYQAFADRVKSATGGRINIKLYGSGEIVPVMEMWDAVSKGVVEMAWSFGSYWVGKTPLAGVSTGLPGTCVDFRDAHAHKYYNGVFEIIQQEYAKHNIYLLNCLPTTEGVIFTKFPVRSVDDLKGKKVRATGFEGEVAAALGMSVVSLPVAEVVQALESGAIDAVIMGGYATGKVYGTGKPTGNVVSPPINEGSGEELIMNLDVWKSLPEDLQTTLTAVARWTALDRVGFSAVIAARDLKWMKDTWGLKEWRLPQSDIVKINATAIGIYEKTAAKDPAFAKALGLIKDYMVMKGYL